MGNKKRIRYTVQQVPHRIFSGCDMLDANGTVVEQPACEWNPSSSR